MFWRENFVFFPLLFKPLIEIRYATKDFLSDCRIDIDARRSRSVEEVSNGHSGHAQVAAVFPVFFYHGYIYSFSEERKISISASPLQKPKLDDTWVDTSNDTTVQNFPQQINEAIEKGKFNRVRFLLIRYFVDSIFMFSFPEFCVAVCACSCRNRTARSLANTP